jgi:hypothetical protein
MRHLYYAVTTVSPRQIQAVVTMTHAAVVVLALKAVEEEEGGALV